MMKSTSIMQGMVMLLTAGAVCLAVQSPVCAQRSGASFLKITPDSRSAGMGGAYTACADDSSAVWWNPGGLASISGREVAGTHAEWLARMRYDFISYAHPLTNGTLAGGVTILDAGSIEGRDENGNRSGDFKARDMSFSFAYARTFRDVTGLGVSAKYIQQSIENEKAHGYAFDIGGITRLSGGGLSVGYGIYNLGPQMRFMNESYSLPLRYALGIGYDLGGLRIAADARREHHDRKTIFSLGTEYVFFPMMTLRVGYLHRPFNAVDSGKTGLGTVLGNMGMRGGFGIQVFGYQMDYAFVPYGELGFTHRMSFTSKF